jgi:hypothetical protein
VASRSIVVRRIVLFLLILAGLGYWWFRSKAPKVVAIDYVAERETLLWNARAQVRHPVATLHYGDRVEILSRDGDALNLRTAAGTVGWVLDARQLMDTALWQRSAALLARAQTMPVQALARTKTVSNVHIEPGRASPRIFQFLRGTPVVVLARGVADVPASLEETASDENSEGSRQAITRQEDWLLVMRAKNLKGESETLRGEADSIAMQNPASPSPVSAGLLSTESESPGMTITAIPVAGWVLRQFIEIDLPGPLQGYANSSRMNVLAWFVLNRVPNGSGGEMPQYLVAGSRDGEAQPCDFSMLRVYTWGKARKRYETAFVENGLCGHLPILVSHAAEPEFRFTESGKSGGEWVYRMRQTSVRRLSPRTSEPSRRKR